MMHACVLLAATRLGVRGLYNRPSLRGDGAPKSANLWLVSRFRDTRAPLGAPVAAIFAFHAGPRFRRKCPAAVLSSRLGSSLRDPRRRERRQSAFGLGLTVVSQLLAGPRNGPGRSPGAARVTCQRDKPRRRRTPSRLTTPHDAPFKWTRWGECTRGLQGGDNVRPLGANSGHGI
jgi:hypothetical protein